jgi:Dolichyl-phosphate-mannose-protein mannosyltransferase
VDGEVGSVLVKADSHERLAVRSRSAVTTTGILVGFAAVAAALHAFLVGRVHGPFVFMDELGYERMAQSFAHNGHFALFGKGGLAYSPLYPIVLSPIYALTTSMHTAYEWAKVENSVLISLSVFPVYGIARFALPRGRSLGVAALSLLAPLMLYSGFEMSESLAYPLCFLAMWAMLRAVRRPSMANDALLLGAIVIASLARLQLVVLVPAALTAFLLVTLARPGAGESRLRAVWRSVREHRLLFGLAGFALVAGLARTAMNGGNLPLAGRYANVGTAHASVWRAFALFFQHLAELDFAVGVIPFATALLAGFALVRFGFPKKALVFASVAVASTFWLLLEVALDAAAFDATSAHAGNASVFTDLPRIHERYLIYLVPFFLVTLFAVIDLRRPGFPTKWHLAGAAIVAAVVPALIPFGTIINGTSAIDSFALQMFGRMRDGHTVSIEHATGLIVALSALLALVFLLAVTRWLPPMAAVLITAAAFLGLSTLEVGKQVTPVTATKLGLPAHADWVDRIVGSRGNVSLVGGPGVSTTPLRETAFWNGSIAHVYFTCQPVFGSDFGEQQLVSRMTIDARYAVVPASMPVSGQALARDPAGKLVLVAPTHGTLRIPPALRCRR